jgi:hypothetical protein
MSETLGPIHTWVFNKIKFQEKEVERLLSLKDGLNVDDAAGVVEKGTLEEIVDIKNIHGFLQIRINITEKRLALTVERLLDSGIKLDKIKETLFEFGVENSFEKTTRPQKAYENLNALMVNGMPCDKVEIVVKNTESRVVFHDNLDIHTEYWKNKETYQILKDEVIKGLLSNTNLSYSHLEERTFLLEEN